MEYRFRLPETLSQFTLIRPKKQNREEVRQALAIVKSLIHKEVDQANKAHLAKAGIELNNLLMR